MRKALFGIIIIILILAAGIGWAIWKARSISRMPPPVLTLQVSDNDEVSVSQGDPLVFTVFLSHPETAPTLRIGRSGRPWHSYLHLESLEAGKSSPLKSSPLGKPYSIYSKRDSSGHLEAVEMYNGDEAILDDVRNLYTAELGVSSGESGRIPAGRYTIQAVLNVPFWPLWRWHGRVVSNPVVVTVQKQVQETPPADQERNRLVRSIEFYIDAGRFEDAYRLALQLKEREPERVYTYVLIGDALNGLHRDQEALEAYDYALELSAKENKYESPEYLLMRRHEVEERLEQH